MENENKEAEKAEKIGLHITEKVKAIANPLKVDVVIKRHDAGGVAKVYYANGDVEAMSLKDFDKKFTLVK